MSDFIEYPKAIYSSDGKFATVGSKDAEDTQREEWGETVLADLPNPLAFKMDQDPVADRHPQEGDETVATSDILPDEPVAEPVAEAPVATEAAAVEVAQ